jgi:hypothetical protein
MRETCPRFLEDGDRILRMLNNVAQQNKIESVVRSVNFQDVPRHKTEVGIRFEGTSPNAGLVHVKPYPAADACYFAQPLQNAALVTPEVADGQAGEREMWIKPRNEDIPSDRILVVEIGESVREKVSTEEVLEGSHEERPIDFPGTVGGPDGVGGS